MKKITFLKTRNLLILLFSVQLLFGSLITNAQPYQYVRFAIGSAVNSTKVNMKGLYWIDDKGVSHTAAGYLSKETPYNIDLDLGVDNAITVASVHMRLHYHYSVCPKDLILQGSNDGETWEVLKSFSGLTADDYPAPYSTKEFVVAGSGTLKQVTSVEISPNPHSINIDDDPYALGVSVTPSDATYQASQGWTSSDETVATVDKNGLITPVALGTTTIGYKVDGITTTSELTVYMSHVTDVNILPETAELMVNKSVQLNAEVLPLDANDKTITWKSDNTAVATVDASGLVNTLSLGVANITATSTDGGIKGTCVVSVVPPTAVTGISVSPITASIIINEQIQLTETITPEKATTKNVTWSSSDISIATVDNLGLVTGIGAGDVIITVKSTDGGYEAVCDVSVAYVATSGISLDANVLSMTIGSKSELLTTVLPSNASNKTIIWSSSETSVATVDATGLVSGKGEGSVNITATLHDGSFYDVCEITVTKEDAFRFIVVADPHASVYKPDFGWQSVRDKWYSFPEVMLQVGAEMILVVGDLHDDMADPSPPNLRDTSYTRQNWDLWDSYEAEFDGIGQMEWCEGFHEIMGPGARQYMADRYPEHINYVVENKGNVFISFDMQLYGNVWDIMYPDSNALDWLEYQLIKHQGKRIFFFQHVPMVYSPNWYSPEITHVDSVIHGWDIKLPNNDYHNFSQTRRMAALLSDYNVEAVFYGHDHTTHWLGNHGGYDAFIPYSTPLLVEVIDGEVTYQWLSVTEDDDVHKYTNDPYKSDALKSLKVAVIPHGENITEEVYDIDPSKPLNLSGGGTVNFIDLNSSTDEIGLNSISGVELGAQIVVLGPDIFYKKISPLLKSSMPFSLYYDTVLMERSKLSTNGTFHLMDAETDLSFKRFSMIFTVDTSVSNFTMFPRTVPWMAPHLQEPFHNNVAILRSITLDKGTLTTDFYPYTRNYMANAPEGVLPVISAATGNRYATMSIVQAQNLSGSISDRTATVTVTSKDLSATYSYTVTFNKQADGINAAPTIDALEDKTYPVGVAPQQINLTGITDGDEGLQTIVITAVSSDVSVVSDVSVDYTSPNNTATLNYTITGITTSSATITVTLNDNGGTADGGSDLKEITFNVSVNKNNKPTIDAVDDLSHELAEGVQTILLTGITDGDNGNQNITIDVVSSATSIVSDVSIDYTSPNDTAILHYNAKGAVGTSATITITVKDDGGTIGDGIDEITEEIVVTIYKNVNNAPTIDGLSDIAVIEDVAIQTISLTGITDGDDDLQTLTITAESSNTSLITNPNVTYTSGTTATLTYTPNANENGSATITITVLDNGGDVDNNGDQSTSIDINIEVAAVNDQPTIDIVADPTTILANAEQQIIELSGITDGDDGSQEISITARAITDGVIKIDSVTNTSIYYTPVADGSTDIKITVKDDAGTTNGGIDSKDIYFRVVVSSAVGINSSSFGKVILYPNPAKDILYVTFEDNSPAQIRITDILGETAMLVNPNTLGTTNIDVSDLKSGIYVLIVEGNDSIYKAKFVIE